DGAGQVAHQAELRGRPARAVDDAGDGVAAAVEHAVEGVDAREGLAPGEVEVGEQLDVLAAEQGPVTAVDALGEELQVTRGTDLERGGLGSLTEQELTVRDRVAERVVPAPLALEVPAEVFVGLLLGEELGRGVGAVLVAGPGGVRALAADGDGLV